MATFSTRDGKKWLIEVNYLTVKRVRDLVGVNVLDICNVDEKTLTGWVSDDLKVLEVLCAVVRPQLAGREMSDDEFFAVCDGAVLKESVERLIDEVADFFQEPRKGLVRKVIQRMRAAESTIATQAEQAVERALQQCESALHPQTHGNSGSTSPESQESSRGVLPFDNSSGSRRRGSTKTGRTRRR